MKNLLRPILAGALAILMGGVVHAEDKSFGFGNESEAARIGYDSFNNSVRKRMEATRVGKVNRNFAASAFSSDKAFAAAPSSRTGTVASSRRKQLDCVYYSGFTIWGDFYQTWARQTSHNGADGYHYRITAPALGFDWSNGRFTVGLASTYGWGRLKSRDYDNKRKVRMWAAELYGQYDADLFYVNATVGYAHNRYHADGRNNFNFIPPGAIPPQSIGPAGYNDKYSGNSWNADAEFGYKFNLGGLRLIPNIGIRYFHDRTDSSAEENDNYTISNSPRNYHTLELPVGVNLSYEIAAGGSLIVPRLRAAWVPELSRKRPGWHGTLYQNGTANSWSADRNTARRSRHGFELGAGLEAKITKSISAHVDYEFNFRSRAQEHHLNLGLGFTF